LKTAPLENVQAMSDLISRFGEVGSQDFFEAGNGKKNQVTLDFPEEREEGRMLFTTLTTFSASGSQELSCFVKL